MPIVFPILYALQLNPPVNDFHSVCGYPCVIQIPFAPDHASWPWSHAFYLMALLLSRLINRRRPRRMSMRQ